MDRDEIFRQLNEEFAALHELVLHAAQLTDAERQALLVRVRELTTRAQAMIDISLEARNHHWS